MNVMDENSLLKKEVVRLNAKVKELVFANRLYVDENEQLNKQLYKSHKQVKSLTDRNRHLKSKEIR